MGKKKSSTVALVEGGEQPTDRLPLEETWPEVHGNDPAGDPEYNANESDGLAYTPDDAEAAAEAPLTLGLSSSGPFIAQAPATPPDNAQAERTARFEKFSEDLFRLCYRHGFIISPTDALDISGEHSRLKKTRRIATALAGLKYVEPKS